VPVNLARLSAVAALALIAGGCGAGAAKKTSEPVPRSPAWQRATPQQEGIDVRVLDKADLTGVTSLLVARHGRLVVERYYGIQAADRVPVFSITKSVVSALVGIALGEGRLRSADEHLADIVPGADRRITLRHLLSMTAGYGRQLNFGPLDPSTLANRPLVGPPGTTFRYDSGSSDLLAAVLARVTGMTAAEYAGRRLFGPLGIRDVRWPGSHGGSGIVLRPRELLAFGQLYLDRGIWQGKRIIPASWVRASTRVHIDIPPGQGVTSAYGYDWWVETRGEPFFAAHGYLGQILAVFPRLDEVVLVTSSGEGFGTSDVVRSVVGATRP
jgi:CubicO group peptidase (beta-lactamase class C family)